eukprot:6204561-Pleurochrysis_carterae.AAC.2
MKAFCIFSTVCPGGAPTSTGSAPAPPKQWSEMFDGSNGRTCAAYALNTSTESHATRITEREKRTSEKEMKQPLEAGPEA